MENHHPANLQYSNSAGAASIKVEAWPKAKFTVIWLAFEYDHELSLAWSYNCKKENRLGAD